MKALGIALVALVLCGCSADPNANGGKGGSTIARSIWTDPETGCQYHFWQSGLPPFNNYAIALAPRIGMDGRPVCAPPRAGAHDR